jgi:hypothetical protein
MFTNKKEILRILFGFGLNLMISLLISKQEACKEIRPKAAESIPC